MRKSSDSLSDWLAVALSPALIVVLLSSLVCFVVEVLYQGEFNARLQFVFCMYVMACVCVARISLEEGSAYAATFAAPVTIVTAIALMNFVQYSGPLAGVSLAVNLGIMGGIWWCSHQLTKDSTLVESGPDETGAGLLSQLGWDGGSPATTETIAPPDFEAVTGEREPSTKSWLEKMIRGDGPHSPGAWALYFSLAALPAFGLGQFLLPANDLEGRRWVFRLFVIYMTAALGLLLTTSFLGIRRYLHQRKLDLPLDMAAAWLTVGTVIIFGLLVIGFLLPRPLPEYSIVHWLPEIKSPERDPSKIAAGEEGTKKGEPGRGKGESEKNGGQGKGQGKDGEKKKDGEPGGEKGDGKQGDGEKGDGEKKGGEKSGDKGEPKGDSQDGPKSSQSGKQEDQSKPPAAPKTGNESQPTPSHEPPKPPPSQASGPSILQRIFGALPDLLNYLGFALLLAVAAFFAYRHRESLREAWKKLLQEWADLWARLFGRPAPAVQVSTAAVPPPLPPAFAEFRDPFTSGQAAKWSLAELVRYSFTALEAWGRERGSLRTEEQTPGEYAQSVAAAQPAVAAEVQQLAALYGQVAYGPGAASQPAAEVVKRFWKRLQAPLDSSGVDMEPDWERQRERMVREQLAARGIADRRVLEAMASVPREAFVEADERAESYRDRALPIRGGQTISQPYTVAFMCEALRLHGAEKTLDIGTGSGYAAAVLSCLCREVVSIERIPHLAEAAAERLKQLGYNNVRVLIGDGTQGSPDDAPFDAVVAAAAGNEVPPNLLRQLADGGRLVIPLGAPQGDQALYRFVRAGERTHKESLGAFSFVPLIGADGWDETK